MNIMSYENFKKTQEYTTFIASNPDTGYLKVQSFTAYQAIPIDEAEITITKDFGNDTVIFFKGYTDSSGIIDNIELPSPKGDTEVKLYETPPYTSYNMTAFHEGYETIKQYNIGMYGGVKVLQYVKLSLNIEPTKSDNND